MAESMEERRYVRTWSPECKHTVSGTGEVSYLCAPDKIPDFDHRVVHETMPPYLSGDYDNLS